MTKRIYIDVDGVLNAVCSGTPNAEWREFRRCTVDGWPICYAPELISRLNEVASRPHVEAFWLTTWEHKAARLISPAIGLEGSEWTVVGAEYQHDDEMRYGWWKLGALREHLADHDGQTLWIDDDITFDSGARQWLNDNPQVSWISPATNTGITLDQADTIRAWAS